MTYLYDRVRAALAELDVESSGPDDRLGDDLGMDSQELLCAAVEMERTFEVPIEDGELRRSMRVADVALLISRKLALKSKLPGFDDSSLEEVVIAAASESVYSALHEVDAWPQRLPHVRSISKRYDDGVYQEFDMSVAAADDSVISVHSIRRCGPGAIRFFQPVPPRFMQHHCGDWILHPLDGRTTHVLTRHQWRLSPDAAEHFPADADVSTGDRVRSWISDHSRFALQCWKADLEGGPVQ
jgi:acyl carrier protein